MFEDVWSIFCCTGINWTNDIHRDNDLKQPRTPWKGCRCQRISWHRTSCHSWSCCKNVTLSSHTVVPTACTKPWALASRLHQGSAAKSFLAGHSTSFDIPLISQDLKHWQIIGGRNFTTWALPVSAGFLRFRSSSGGGSHLRWPAGECWRRGEHWSWSFLPLPPGDPHSAGVEGGHNGPEIREIDTPSWRNCTANTSTLIINQHFPASISIQLLKSHLYCSMCRTDLWFVHGEAVHKLIYEESYREAVKKVQKDAQPDQPWPACFFKTLDFIFLNSQFKANLNLIWLICCLINLTSNLRNFLSPLCSRNSWAPVACPKPLIWFWPQAAWAPSWEALKAAPPTHRTHRTHRPVV